MNMYASHKPHTFDQPILVDKMAANQNAQTPVPIYETAPATSAAILEHTPVLSTNQRFKVRAAKITGGLQIACAVLSVTFGVLALQIATCKIGDVDSCRKQTSDEAWVVIYFPAKVGWPIWGGVSFYFVAGILGLCSGSRSTCVIVAYMVMSLISSVSACGQMIMESIGSGILSTQHCYYYSEFDKHGEPHSETVCFSLAGLKAMYGLSAAVASVEMVVAIVSAVYCCQGVCCGPSSHAQQQVIVQCQPNAQGQVFQQLPSGLFQLNIQGQVFYQPSVGPFPPNVQTSFYPPTGQVQFNAQGQVLHQIPNVLPDDQPPKYEKIKDHPYQEYVKR